MAEAEGERHQAVEPVAGALEPQVAWSALRMVKEEPHLQKGTYYVPFL